MSRIRTVIMKFDLRNQYDAATYEQLKESARRAFRRGRGRQAHYLASLMLGTRPYCGLQQTGITERPEFPLEIDERLSHLQARIKEAENRISHLAGRLVRKQRRAPALRLVPTTAHQGPQQSA